MSTRTFVSRNAGHRNSTLRKKTDTSLVFDHVWATTAFASEITYTRDAGLSLLEWSISFKQRHITYASALKGHAPVKRAHVLVGVMWINLKMAFSFWNYINRLPFTQAPFSWSGLVCGGSLRAWLQGGRVNVASGLTLAERLKIARVCKQTFTGRVTLQLGTTWGRAVTLEGSGNNYEVDFREGGLTRLPG